MSLFYRRKTTAAPSSAAVHPCELYVREAFLRFVPTALGGFRFKPYIRVHVNGGPRFLRTRRIIWKDGPMNFASLFNFQCDPTITTIRLELWHRRRVRRDLMVASAMLPLTELLAASEQGFALDRWLPFALNPTYETLASGGPGAHGGLGTVHVLCRLALPPPPVYIAGAGVGATSAIAHQHQAAVAAPPPLMAVSNTTHTTSTTSSSGPTTQPQQAQLLPTTTSIAAGGAGGGDYHEAPGDISPMYRSGSGGIDSAPSNVAAVNTLPPWEQKVAASRDLAAAAPSSTVPYTPGVGAGAGVGGGRWSTPGAGSGAMGAMAPSPPVPPPTLSAFNAPGSSMGSIQPIKPPHYGFSETTTIQTGTGMTSSGLPLSNADKISASSANSDPMINGGNIGGGGGGSGPMGTGIISNGPSVLPQPTAMPTGLQPSSAF